MSAWRRPSGKPGDIAGRYTYPGAGALWAGPIAMFEFWGLVGLAPALGGPGALGWAHI